MAIIKTVGKVINQKTLSAIGVMDVVGAGLTAFNVVSDYKNKRMEGHGVLSSGISAAGSALMYESIGWGGMLGLNLLKNGPALAINTTLNLEKISRTSAKGESRKLFNNATFIDTKQAFTMRQAGMQLAENSKYNMQQYMMGNEANVMHKL